MQKQKTFTLEEIEKKLQELNIPFLPSSSQEKAASGEQYTFKSLREVGPKGIYFLVPEITNLPHLTNSIILCLKNSDYPDENNIALQVDNPQVTFYKLMEALVGEAKRPTGIHPTAIIAGDCDIHPTAYVGPYCVLEDCTVLARAKLHSHVTLMPGTTVEEDVTIESHSTVGVTGVAWIWDPVTHRRVVQPQTGKTLVGKGSFLGSNVTVGRGSVNETTVIGPGCMITHGSKISHGSRIGEGCHLSTNVSITGNVDMGKECFVGAGVVITPHIKLAERIVIGAGSVVVKSAKEPEMILMGSPAKPIKPVSDSMSGVPKPLKD